MEAATLSLKNVGRILDDEEEVAVALLDRTYQASDLAGAARREFLDRAKLGSAHLRDTDGTPLVMLPENDLSALQALSGWLTTYLALETALGRPREERQPTDFGGIAWAVSLSENDLAEMRDEFRATLAVAASQRDARPVETLLRDWRYTAIDLADPVSGRILRGEYSDDDFVDAARPGSASSAE